MFKNLLFFLLGSTFVLTIFATYAHQSKDPGIFMTVSNCKDLYAGIDNTINIIAMEGDPISLDQLTCNGGTITGNDGWFYVKPYGAGDLRITLKAYGQEGGWNFPVKRIIPDPRLGARYNDGTILDEKEFKAQQGVAAVLNCCGFDAKCDVVSYSITRISQAGPVYKAENKGMRFGTAAMEIIQRAKPGDSYFFSKILAKCPGEAEYYEGESPYLTSMLIEIK